MILNLTINDDGHDSGSGVVVVTMMMMVVMMIHPTVSDIRIIYKNITLKHTCLLALHMKESLKESFTHFLILKFTLGCYRDPSVRNIFN